MRIAVSGTHAAGKSTLVAELSALLPDHVVVDEPYHLLAEEGHEFAETPSVDDFALQLERSIECVSAAGPDVILDRCPADLLAYLRVHPDGGDIDLPRWTEDARSAMARLDLVVFVPVEARDRIALPAWEDPRFRRRVDAALREILLDDPWDFGVDVLEVAGSPRERARRVMAHLRGRRGA
jgi:predicted ATPase